MQVICTSMGFSRKELTLEIHPHIVWVPATPIKKMAKKDKESPNYEKKAGKPFNHSKMGPIFTSFTPYFTPQDTLSSWFCDDKVCLASIVLTISKFLYYRPVYLYYQFDILGKLFFLFLPEKNTNIPNGRLF